MFNKSLLPFGVDEAGRGPYAGPVSVAVVSYSQEILSKIRSGKILCGLDDSKKISPKKREDLYKEICKNAFLFSHSFVSPAFIDKMNINYAICYGIVKCLRKLKIKNPYFFIDGNYNFDKYPIFDSFKDQNSSIVKGDQKLITIASASIIAKVKRDDLMLLYSKKYPDYLFEKHKGYGTKAHESIIKKLGLLPIHRKSFTRKFL